MVNERMSETPDKFTLAWWSKQFAEVTAGYRGATHGINRALALYDDFVSESKELRKRIDDLEREREVDRAKIGQLQERVERMAIFLNAQKKNGSTEPKL